MNHGTRKCLRGVPALAICAFISISAAAQGRSNPLEISLPVQVVNTPNVNLANTPNVNVANTPNVNVANTPSVSVTNTPSVNIANTPTVMLEGGASVNVTNPLDGQGNPTPMAVLDAVQPFEDFCFIVFSNNSQGSCFMNPIPQGKELVVQNFDLYGFLPTGLRPLYVTLQLSPTSQIHGFSAPFTATNTVSDFFVADQPTRLYAASATTGPQLNLLLSAPAGSGTFTFNISGYLVDLPLPGGR